MLSHVTRHVTPPVTARHYPHHGVTLSFGGVSTFTQPPPRCEGRSTTDLTRPQRRRPPRAGTAAAAHGMQRGPGGLSELLRADAQSNRLAANLSHRAHLGTEEGIVRGRGLAQGMRERRAVLPGIRNVLPSMRTAHGFGEQHNSN